MTANNTKTVSSAQINYYSRNNMFYGNNIQTRVTKKEYEERISEFEYRILTPDSGGYVAYMMGAQEPHYVEVKCGDLILVTNDDQILGIIRHRMGRKYYGICPKFN